MIAKIKLDYNTRIKNGTIGDAIVGTVKAIVRTVEDDEDQAFEELAVNNIEEIKSRGQHVLSRHMNT